MPGPEHLHDYQAPPAKPARAGEILWTLTKDGVRVTAELLDQSSAGVELRMLRNGEWMSGRRFAEPTNAKAHAESHRAQMVAKGWT
jgi:hypothetical protein